MLKPRVIPVLLIQNKGLVKTVKFKDPKYVGDPLNAVRIFNEKEVDELVVLDIDASTDGREPNYTLIENLAAECRMPLCYGGGIRTVAHAEKILSLGVEKIAISSAFFENPELIEKISKRVGSQSVVVVLDVRKKRITRNYECYVLNGKISTKKSPFDMARLAEKLGAGEVLINSIDLDGVGSGYDLSLVFQLNSNLELPLTVLGGVGNYGHIGELISQEGIIGAAAGSVFVFKGKYRAVLINYPKGPEKEAILNLSGYSK